MNKLLVIAIIALFVHATASEAQVTAVTITPSNTVVNGLKFDVGVKEHQVLVFTVSVSITDNQPAPEFMKATLFVSDDAGILAQCPVSADKKDKSYEYQFMLDKRTMPKSFLIISTGHFVDNGEANGNNVMPDAMYTVKLKEFMK